MQFRLRDYASPFEVLVHHRRMRAAPFWSADRLDDWSRSRRTGIVAHAYRHVPYYRRLLDQHGIDPSKVEREEVWRRIPLLSKDILREHQEDLTASGAYSRGAVWAGTSGSTAAPLRFLLDRHVNAAAFALFWRAWSSGGHWRLGQRQAALKGLNHPDGWRYHRVIRTLEMSSGRLDRATARLYRELLSRFRPRFLRGYPSALYLFCRLLRDQGLAAHVPMVISGSEMLHDFQRSLIEAVLETRIYNPYTHWERAASILECDKGRMHAQEDYAHHEILDAEGNPVPAGVPGEITSTGLFNLAMPLVRYRTGDIARWSMERCPCGQVFPAVERIEGRQNDYLVSRSGTLIPSTYTVTGFKAFPEILYIQLIQRELESVEVRIVKAPGYRDPEDTERVRAELHVRLGRDMRLDIRFCTTDELERNPVGKIRSCYNRLPPAVIERYGLPAV